MHWGREIGTESIEVDLLFSSARSTSKSNRNCQEALEDQEHEEDDGAGMEHP